MFLTDSFVGKYKDEAPFGGNGLGKFVYLRTYSRWLEDSMRREKWSETVKRVVEYSMSLYQGPSTQETLQKEAEQLFDAIYNLRMFTSGRTLWTGGTVASRKYPLSNYNCAFTVVDSFTAMSDAFYLLMVGAGVGFRILPTDVEKLAPINTDIVLANKPYHPKAMSERIEFTQSYEGDGSVYIIVGDSKEGWVEALKIYLSTIQRNDIESIMINYDSVRPSGEKLKTFGGRASGHGALRDMFRSIHKIVRSGTDKLKPIQVLDIMNHIGHGVVVGGVRRTAEIAVFDMGDTEVLDAKVDMWTEGTTNYGQLQRTMSNNSIMFSSKPTREQLLDIFTRIQSNGEPGFINRESAMRRRPNFNGVNPCAEILLDSNGVCNLTEVNLMSFVFEGNEGLQYDAWGIEEVIRLATRVGLRMTNVTLELDNWDAVQKRDRLTGVSLTGVMDFVDALGLTTRELEHILDRLNVVANAEAVQYAKEMRIPTPLLVTTVKPSGTLSQLPTVSSGVHRAYAPFYVRRVRISSTDPLAKVMLDSGFPVYPENGQGPTAADFDKLTSFDKIQCLQRANTWVIEFPVKTQATIKSSDESALDQLNRYLLFQSLWTDHNTSITITFKPEEVEGIVDTLLDRWDDYIAVSFLPDFNAEATPYPLMPYTAISEDEYNARSTKLKDVSMTQIYDKLTELEREQAMSELLDSDCNSGVCAVR